MKTLPKRLTRSALAAFLLMLLIILPANADANPPDALSNLFSENNPGSIEGTAAVPDSLSPEIIRQRSAVVDTSLLAQIGRSAPRPDQPAFTLNFFEDAQFTAFISKTEIFDNGAVGLVGTVDSAEFNELVIVSNQHVIQAYLQVGEQLFEIRTTRDGHLIVEVDQSAYPDSLPPIAPPESAEGSRDDIAAREADPIPAADSGATIDVLAVYTPAAVSYLGSKLAVETRIQQSILSSNNGYQNSGINPRLRLVGMEQVSYNENPSGVDYTDRWYYAIDRLTSGQAYAGDAVHLADARAYREQYGADLVFMVTNLPAIYCGLGWVAGGPYDSAYGYSVIHAYCSGSSSYTPQHEMGHNMGACHDWNNTSVTIKPHCWDDYSYGYQQPNQFYTVMAYSNGCGSCSRINRWSNPDLNYNGFPTSGLVTGQTVYPSNKLTLNNTANNVANYRQSKISPISGNFLYPTNDDRVKWPRTTLEFNPSSTEGTITSVKFHAYYDSSWHFLGTDNDGSDGWTHFWNSSAVSEQTIKLQAVVTDSAANTEPIVETSLSLTSAMLSDSGYESRGGKGNLTTGESGPSAGTAVTDPEPLLTEHPPALIEVPAQVSKPVQVIPELPPPVLHYKHLLTRRVMPM